jgi:hypothetical protein
MKSRRKKFIMFSFVQLIEAHRRGLGEGVWHRTPLPQVSYRGVIKMKMVYLFEILSKKHEPPPRILAKI